MLVFQLLQNFGACMSLPQSFHASSDQVLKGQKLITITPVMIKIYCKNLDIEKPHGCHKNIISISAILNEKYVRSITYHNCYSIFLQNFLYNNIWTGDIAKHSFIICLFWQANQRP